MLDRFPVRIQDGNVIVALEQVIPNPGGEQPAE